MKELVRSCDAEEGYQGMRRHDNRDRDRNEYSWGQKNKDGTMQAGLGTWIRRPYIVQPQILDMTITILLPSILGELHSLRNSVSSLNPNTMLVELHNTS